MEKVTIKAVLKTKSKNGKDCQDVILGDDRKCTAWEHDFKPLEGKEVEVNIVAKGDWLNIYLPGNENKGATTPQKNWVSNKPDPVFEIRKNSIAGALEMLRSDPKSTVAQHPKWIKYYEHYLTTGEFKEVDPPKPTV